jgi:hypothetical protein
MKTLFFLVCSIPLWSCSQSTGNISKYYTEADYKQISKGPNEDYPFVITYIHRLDSNYKMRKIFFDSSYNENSVVRLFYYKNQLTGPYERKINGIITERGEYKNGEKHGERFRYYDNGKLREKASFQNGKKHGVWEEYDKDGKVIRKEVYENDKLIDGKNN